MKYKKLLFYLYIYKILKTTQQFYFNKSKILGQDRFMVASKQNEYKNYPMVVYYLKENHNNLPSRYGMRTGPCPPEAPIPSIGPV